jgi:substrate import-associated zinc metallohydrolase lipoprotein
MKKVCKFLVAISLLLGLAACENNQFTESIFIDPVVDTTTYTYKFDKWLEEFYTEPYNVSFMYKLDDNGTNPNYNVVPVSIGIADSLAHLALYLWYDVYDSIIGPEFLPTYGPKMIQLVGSSMIHPSNPNSETLGFATGGIKITLLKINDMTFHPKDLQWLNRYIFKTMHHEFSHILHQQKNYPQEYGQINPTDYDPIKWEERTEQQAWELGYVSNYGSSDAHEDFVEVIANYIVQSEDWWQNMLQKAGPTGATIIQQKWEICNTWLADKWNIDLQALHDEVQKRQANLDWDMIMKFDEHLKANRENALDKK